MSLSDDPPRQPKTLKGTIMNKSLLTALGLTAALAFGAPLAATSAMAATSAAATKPAVTAPVAKKAVPMQKVACKATAGKKCLTHKVAHKITHKPLAKTAAVKTTASKKIEPKKS
jgi:hypothetical protein